MMQKAAYLYHTARRYRFIDEKTGKQIGAITDLNGVHGIAIAPDLNKGFISSGKDSTVVVFDATNYKVLDRVKVHGSNPDVITYCKSLNAVFAFNNDYVRYLNNIR